MSHTIRRMGGNGTTQLEPTINSENLDSYWQGGKIPTPWRQADELILLVGAAQPSPSDPARLHALSLGAWLGTSLSPNHGGMLWLLDHLKQEALLEHSGPPGGNLTCSVKLTMRGWKKYDELNRVQVNSRTAFMAMKFGDAQLDQVVEDCFRPAVRRAGFELRKLTDEQPAGLIDDQIKAALLSGRFVIADLTHGSHGAYWEAGFAEGLGLPVIYTCETKAWTDKQTHFDTNHMVTIVWDTADLKKAGDALTATIRATLRAEAKQQD
jgi:hypothetical protein